MSEELVMNTETGALEAPAVIGASALVRRVASAMNNEVNTPAGGASMTPTTVTVTATQGENTQTWTATGDTSVTASHDAVTTQRIGTRTAAVALLALTGFNRDHVADTLAAALFDYQEGEAAALSVLLGVSEEALANAEEVYADLAREMVAHRAAAARVRNVTVEQTVDADAAVAEA